MAGTTANEVLQGFGITAGAGTGDAPSMHLYVDLSPAELVEHAVKRGEGELASNGALVIKTGERTGRSPGDRFIVDTPDVHDKIAWGEVNRPIAAER